MNYMIDLTSYCVSPASQSKKANQEQKYKNILRLSDKASEVWMTGDINWLSILHLKNMDWKGLMLTNLNVPGVKLNTHIMGTDQIIRGQRSNFLELTSTHNFKHAAMHGLLLNCVYDYLAEDSPILPGT